VDETYIRVKGKLVYLYRAVDATGATIDFLLSAKRDAVAAERFLAKAMSGANHPAPRVIKLRCDLKDRTAVVGRAKEMTLRIGQEPVSGSEDYPIAGATPPRPRRRVGPRRRRSRRPAVLSRQGHVVAHRFSQRSSCVVWIASVAGCSGV
jgi:hypothetical protein